MNLRAADLRVPAYFTNELVAFTNGSAVVAAMRAVDEQSKAHVQSLIGARVLFQGISYVLPNGTNADLNLGSGILLNVELNPERDVRPGGRMWRAEVVGTLEGVDFQKRIIRIKTRPECWFALWVR